MYASISPFSSYLLFFLSSNISFPFSGILRLFLLHTFSLSFFLTCSFCLYPFLFFSLYLYVCLSLSHTLTPYINPLSALVYINQATFSNYNIITTLQVIIVRLGESINHRIENHRCTLHIVTLSCIIERYVDIYHC